MHKSLSLLLLLSLIFTLIHTSAAAAAAEYSLQSFTVNVALTNTSKAAPQFQTVAQPNKLSATLSADQTQFLHIHYDFKLPFTPQQVMLQLKHTDTQTGLSALIVPSQTDAYHFKVALGSAELLESLQATSGTYHLIALIADSQLQQQVNYEFGLLQLRWPEAAQQDFVETAAIYSKKSEIAHTFRSGEVSPIFVLPLLFSLLVTLPLLALCYMLFLSRSAIKIELSREGSELIAALTFHGSLVSFVALYILYWVKLNIFEAGVGVAALTVVALLSGNRTLRAVHLRKKRLSEQATTQQTSHSQIKQD